MVYQFQEAFVLRILLVGSSRQVDFLEELIKEHNSFNLMGVKESRQIAGLKDISTPSGTGEAMLGAEAEERICIVFVLACLEVPYCNMIGSRFWHAKFVGAVLNCHNTVPICVFIRRKSSLLKGSANNERQRRELIAELSRKHRNYLINNVSCVNQNET